MAAFHAALDALFADPNLATPALYQQVGVGAEVAIRILRRSPDRMIEFGAARLVSDSMVLDVRVSDCPELSAGDRIEIAGEIFAGKVPHSAIASGWFGLWSFCLTGRTRMLTSQCNAREPT